MKIELRPCPNCASSKSEIQYETAAHFVVRCKQCGLVFHGNPVEAKSLYDEYHETTLLEFIEYSEGSDSPDVRELYSINQQRVKWLQKFRLEGTLLDIGCGRGYFLKSASDAGFSVFGIDVAQNAIDYVQKQFSLKGVVKSIDELLQAGEKYDVITLWHVLEHFYNPFDELSKIHNLLKDGGVCFIEVPNLNSLKFRLSKSKWHGGNHPKYHRTFFSSKTLQQALTKSGFQKVQRQKISYKTPEQSFSYWFTKKILNQFAADSFLDFAAFK